MRRFLAIVCAMLTFSVPALAQTISPTGQPVPQQATGQTSSDGLTAFGQEPPPALDTTALLIGGGVLVGGAIIVGVIANNNRGSDTTTPPASP